MFSREQRQFSGFGSKYVFVIPILATLINIIFLLWVTGKYFDFTDEGYSINLIADPNAFEGRITRFGELLSWLFHLIGQNIHGLRIISVLTIFSLSYIVFHLAIKESFPKLADFALSEQLTDSQWPAKSLFAVVISSVSILSVWPSTTPTYNTINYISMLLLCSSILFVEYARLFPLKPLNIFGLPKSFILVAPLSLSLCFIAYSRLTSYLALCCILAVLTLFLESKYKQYFWSSLALSGFLFITSSIYIFGSLGALLDDMRHAYVITSSWNYLGFDFSFLSSLIRAIPRKLNILAIAFVFVFMYLVSNLRKIYFARLFFLLAIFSFLVSIAGLILLPNFDVVPIALCRPSKSTFLAFIMPLIFIMSYLAFFNIRYFGFLNKLLRLFNSGLEFQCSLCSGSVQQKSADFVMPNLSLFEFNNFILLSLPLVFAFSSSNGVISHGSLATFFPLLAFFRVFSNRFQSVKASAFDFPNRIALLFFAVVPIVVSLSLIYNYVACPFPSLKSISHQNRILTFPSQHSLFVSDDVASHVYSLRRKAFLSGFKEGDPILDLTSGSPGLIYALGGKPVGWPWILGILPGSDNAAVKILDKVQEDELQSSYILIPDSPTGNLKPYSVLKRLSINLDDTSSYQLIDSQYSPSIHAQIHLYKPLRDN